MDISEITIPGEHTLWHVMCCHCRCRINQLAAYGREDCLVDSEIVHAPKVDICRLRTSPRQAAGPACTCQRCLQNPHSRQRLQSIPAASRALCWELLKHLA